MGSITFLTKKPVIPPSIGAGFDSLLTNANLVLTNDNRTATGDGTGGYKQALCDVPKSSGKLYFECIAGPNPLFQYSEVGIQNGNEALNVRLGSTNDAWGYMDQGRLYHTNSYVSNYHSWTNGAIVNIAVDFNLGYIWCGVNGTWWNGSGGTADPSTGLDPLGTGISGTFYPAIAINATVGELTICLGSGSQTYTPPSGFSAWD